MTRRKYTKKPSEFFEKYRHPHWQEKRLKVMDAAGFKCKHCGDTEATLNVHHISYLKGRDPWEYENDELVCLCEACHEEMHSMEDRLKDALHKFKVQSYGDYLSIEHLIGYLTAQTQTGPFRIKAHDDCLWLEGFLDGYGCSSEIYKKDLAEFRSLRELIIADDGYLDHEWLRFYAHDHFFCKSQADFIREHGVYMREGFPSWYKDKVIAMVTEFDGVEE